ncbi:hypothetical protein DFS34DRAFT_617996 [Phlyctochytrium arcticum]|nr:hypothetical protein DFS34DRAFT_617996 [Phlyctochytrium arcticum]
MGSGGLQFEDGQLNSASDHSHRTVTLRGPLRPPSRSPSRSSPSSRSKLQTSSERRVRESKYPVSANGWPLLFVNLARFCSSSPVRRARRVHGHPRFSTAKHNMWFTDEEFRELFEAKALENVKVTFSLLLQRVAPADQLLLLSDSPRKHWNTYHEKIKSLLCENWRVQLVKSKRRRFVERYEPLKVCRRQIIQMCVVQNL